MRLGVNDHGFRLTEGADRMAEYLTKVGHETTWTVSHELTKQVVKRGRGSNRSPMDLLWSFLAGDDGSGGLFREYASAMKGNRQLQWSPGGRAALGLGAELSDQEVADQVEDTAVLMARATLAEWRVILANDLRGELLEVAGRGDPLEVDRWLSEVGVR